MTVIEIILLILRLFPGGGGTEQNFIVGRLRPEIQPLTFLYTIFDREGLPSVYLFLVHSQTAMTDFLVLS